MTKNLIAASELVDVALLDHIVLGCYEFRPNGSVLIIR